MDFDVIIGNPPYGQAACMAVRFVNKSAELTDNLMYVLPRSFTRDAVINRVHPDWHLRDQWDLPDDTFPRSIRAIYQRWGKDETQRAKIPTYRTHPDFTFLKYEDKDEANMFIGGAGAGPAGKVKTEGYDHYAPGHHYLKCDTIVVERFIKIAPQLRAHSRNACCLPGLGKSDIIKIYMENYEKDDPAPQSGHTP